MKRFLKRVVKWTFLLVLLLVLAGAGVVGWFAAESGALSK